MASKFLKDSRFPKGLPDQIKVSLIREAMVLAIKDQQKRIVEAENELAHQFDNATTFGKLLEFSEIRERENIGEAYQIIRFYKDIYENATQIFDKMAVDRIVETAKAMGLRPKKRGGK